MCDPFFMPLYFNTMKHWNNITIEDYQLIYGIIADKTLLDEEKEIKLVGIINGMTDEQIEELTIAEFKDLKKSIQFLHDGKIQGKVKHYINVNGKEYAISLDAFKIRYGRYVDLTTFLSSDNGLVANLHLIMASLAVPVKKTWYGKRKELKYGDVPHSEVSEDMLKANFADCYHTAVFFWKVINGLTKATVVFSVKQLLREKKITKQKLRELLKPLKNDGDGFTMLNY